MRACARHSVSSAAQYQIVSSNLDGHVVSKPEWAAYSGRWGKYEKLSWSYTIDYVFDDYTYVQTEVGAGPYRTF